MAIHYASPKMTAPTKAVTMKIPSEAARERQKRKPSGNAKAAVTLRLSAACVAYFRSEFGDDWRAQMQYVLQSAAR